MLKGKRKQKPIVPGANWGTWENEKCSECLETKTIVYKFLNNGKLLISECVDCLADHI